MKISETLQHVGFLDGYLMEIKEPHKSLITIRARRSLHEEAVK
jgi:hypothetical protein